MARRRKKGEEHVNHERWIVSYADFVTMLFAFFVVMFAISQVDAKKVGRFTESFNGALQWEILPGVGRGILPGEPPRMAGSATLDPKVLPAKSGLMGAAARAEKLEQQKSEIKKALGAKLGSSAKVEGLKVEEIHGEIVVRLPEHLLFATGEAYLAADGRATLDALAELFIPKKIRMRVEGHTDTVPMHGWRYTSNWELSAARATACVEYLVTARKFPPERLSAAGYGEHRPVAPNDTPDGRAQNRRVDIVIMDELPMDESEFVGPPPPAREPRP